jgi:hypothetical protein
MGLAAMAQLLGKAQSGAGNIHHLKKLMIDLIYVAVVALFFVAGEVYAHWCEKL